MVGRRFRWLAILIFLFPAPTSAVLTVNPNDIPNIKAAAEAGDSSAQYTLAVMRYKGQLIEKDVSAGIQWFERAAAQGEPRAAFTLGAMLYNGQDVEQDQERGLKFLKTAARAGNANAVNYLTKLRETYSKNDSLNSDEISAEDMEAKIEKQVASKVYKDKYGFRGIPFATPYDEVLEIIKSDTALYPNGYEWDGYHYIEISSLELGTLWTRVSLYFDHKDRFYSYLIKTSKESAEYFESKTVADAKYLSKVFTNKFGPPTQSRDQTYLGILSVRLGYYTFLDVWQLKDVDIFTGFSTSDFEYYAVGSVESKKLAKELENHKKDLERKNAAKGSREF